MHVSLCRSLAVRRAKKGTPSTHPIRGDELRALRRLAREQDPKSPFVFAGRRSMPQHVWMRLEAEFRRFACDTGALHAYLGHKNIQRTVHYTKLSPDRFKDFWR